MFDVSARPVGPRDVWSFGVPIAKFRQMEDDMPQSFLITPSWSKIRQRFT